MLFLNLPTKRAFAIVFIEADVTASFPCRTLQEILAADNSKNNSNDFEYIYAIQDNIDAVLDLKLGERLMMNFNRDSADSTGFIKRIR